MNPIRDLLVDASSRCFEISDVELTLEVPRDPRHGDFSANIAMLIAAELDLPPRDVAQQIADHIVAAHPNVFDDVAIAGPGFVNMTVVDDYLLGLLNQEQERPYAGQTVVIETNNPNPFKDIHIGHAYNAIISDSISRLLEAGGATVHRVSYHGDVGLHVGKSLWAMLDTCQGNPSRLMSHLKGLDPDKRARFLSESYARGAKAYDDSPACAQEIETLTKTSFALVEGSPLHAAYTTCRQWSFDYFTKAFAEIGCLPVERRFLESETSDAGRFLVEANIGDIFEHSDGAVIFRGEDYDLHTRVFIASRGTTLYEARDLGLMVLKQHEFNPDRSVIVTAVEQDTYFKVIFKVAELVLGDSSTPTENIATGTVKLSTGKMSSRTGQAVNIEWLFSNLQATLSSRWEAPDTVPMVIIGALRYAFLKNRLASDVVFDIDDAIAIDGNTGPYLQYAHARARSIVRKCTTEPNIRGLTKAMSTAERALVLKMSRFAEVTDSAILELKPNAICTHLFELCRAFNTFYEAGRIVGGERESEGQALVLEFADQLRTGLTLLGIPAPDAL